MKRIVLKSKLSEEEALSKFRKISDKLIAQGVLSKGDELVADVDDVDGENSILITINADLMDKDKYRKLKPELLSIGELITNDLKNFDEVEEPTEPKPEEGKEGQHDNPKEPISKENPKVAEGQNKEEQQDAVNDNLVKPAVMALHDTSDLLFDIDEQNNLKEKSMSEIKDLLFDESELKEVTFDDLLFDESECREVTFDDLLFDDEEIKKEEPSNEEPKKEGKEGEEKLHCGDAKTFDDLLFDESELKKEDPKPAEPKPAEEPKPTDPNTGEEKTHDDQPEKKEDPKPAEPKPAEEPKPTNPNTGEEKKFDGKLEPADMKKIHEAMKELKEAGKEATIKEVAEKCGCTEEMVKEASRYFDELGITPKAPEAPKGKFKVLGVADSLVKDGFATKSEAEAYAKDQKLTDFKVVEYTIHDEIDPEKVEKVKKVVEDLKKEGKEVTFEEVMKACECTKKEFDEAVKAEEPKKEDPKPEEKQELTRDELIKKLNKENEGNTLLGVAKKEKGIIK